MAPPTPEPTRAGAALHAGFSLLFVVVAAWSWAGLVSAELGSYRPRAVAAVSALGALACGWRMRRSLREDVWRVPPRAGLHLLACLALATVFFFRPGEYLIDGGDGSVYLNLGRAVSRSGGLSFAEPVLDHVDPALWPDLFDRDAAWPHLLNLFPGGIQIAPGVNRVQPNFFHLFPIWVANVEGVIGARGGYYVNAVFGVLAVAALWMLGVRLSSLAAGTAAAGLLAISFAEIWFARFPTSEMLTQYLILSGLYFAVAHAQRPARSTAVCAGAAFGLAGLCRLDALVLVSPVVAAYLVCTARRDRLRYWSAFTAVFLALTLHAVVHALVWSRPYTARIAWHLVGGWVRPASLIAPAAVVAAAALWWLSSRAPRTRASRRLLWIVTGIAVAVLVVRLAPRVVHGYPAMLFTVPGLAAAVAGAGILACERPARHALLVVAVYAASSLAYFDSVRDMTAMPMLLRRFVPVILPLTLLLATHAFSRVSSLTARLRWIGWAAPAALALVLATRSAPLLAAPPMQGVAPQLAAMAALVPTDAVVLVDGSTPSHLGLSLHCTEGRDVLWISRGPATGDAIASVAASLRSSGRRVFLLVGSQGDTREAWLRPGDFTGFELQPAGSAAIAHREIETTIDRLPSRMRAVAPIVELYEIVPAGTAALPLQIEIGGADFPWRREGFHDAEHMGAVVARWSAAVASIALPRVAVSGAPLVLRIRLAGPRPAGIAPPRVQVEINGHPAGATTPLSPGFQTYELPLDAAATNALGSGATVLTLRVPAFVPSETGGGDDARHLGAAVDWVRIDRR